MSDPPWKDALRRAKAPPMSAAAAAAASRASASRPQGGVGADPAALSPNLARLMAERQALEARMSALTGQGGLGDPRYAVTPLDQRRAELERWGATRDAIRAMAMPRVDPHPAALPPALRGTAADAMRATPGESLRGTPGEQVRPTPGDLTPDLRRFSPTEVFERATSQREAPWERIAARRESDPLAEPSRRLASLGEAGRGLRDAGRALRGVGERPVAASASDPLDRRLARARDMVSRGRRAYDAAERALDSARDAIPSDWLERARERIPGLGRADPYVRETARKLTVAVGELADFADKAERMREMASDVRELKEADEARDDARRDRALERLKAKRSEDARDSSEGDA